MKLVHVTLFHERPEVSAVWIDRMKGKPVAACVTRGDRANIALLKKARMPFIEHDNRPLGRKANAALAFALTMRPDAVMIHPSDDFVSERWTSAALDLVREGVNYVLPARCGMHEPWTGRSCVLDQRRGVLGCGSGRIVSRFGLELAGQMWPDMAPRSLDHRSHNRLVCAGLEPHYLDWSEGVPIVDIKGHRNIWSFNEWVQRGTHATPDQVLWMLSEEERARVAGFKAPK